MTIKEIIQGLKDCQAKANNCNDTIFELVYGINKAIYQLQELNYEYTHSSFLGREECWSSNIRVNIPVPDESGVGLDNTWSVDKYYIVGTLKEQFLDCDIVFVSCGEGREGAITYNVDIEVCYPFDQSLTVEQNEMAIDHDLHEFCKARGWLVITK